MRKFIRRLGSDWGFTVCVLCLALMVVGLCVFRTYASLTPEERAKRRYDQLMTQEVLSVGDLADTWSDTAWNFIEVAIPDAVCWTQTKGPVPFDPTGFPKDFLDKMIGYLEGESDVPVYELLIYQDRLNRDICFLNSDYKPIYVIECPYGEYCADDAYALERYPDLYESEKYDEKEIEAIIAHLDPARVLLKVTLIPSDRIYEYLLDQAKGEGDEEPKEKDGGGGAKTGGGSNDLWVAIVGPGQGATNGIEVTVHLPVGFTNMVDVFTFDAEPGSKFDGIESDPWTLSVTNEDTTGTNQILWIDTDTDGISNRFYVAGSSWDEDGDGLASAREIFLHRTDPALWDTDGDGFSDGDEINTYGTDALDKYSVPPPQMLSVSGSYLVDESTNPVVIKSVNIGAWLQWEQWMLMFEPHLWTNDWGRVYGLKSLGADDETDEQTAREILIDNVDAGAAVTLRATQYSAKRGVALTNWSWIGDDQVTFIDSFTNSSWLCFSNVNFGAGFSNLAVGLAVPQENAGNRIAMHLDAPDGALVGVVTTRTTGGWGKFTEQYLSGFSISGTQTIYFVGSGTNLLTIANLYRFRFFGDAPNTTNLFETFRNNYFTTNDLDKIKALGYNCIRLPFFHTILEDDFNPYQYKTSGWNRLDWAIDECAKRRLWVILDLHSTPGGQNPYHASGFADPFKNRLWDSDEYKDRTAALWVEIARRYSNNPAVAGYDLFNEPSPPRSGDTPNDYRVAFSNYVIPLVTKLHSAVRSNDTRHVLFVGNNFMYTNAWSEMWSCPNPASQGWTNVAYEFHVYDQTVYGQNDTNDWWFSTQKGICDDMIRTLTRLSEARQVPVYIGEYAPWTEQNFEYWTRQLQANDLSWGHWNYRSWGWDNPDKPEEGKTIWGLDYRSNKTNNVPDLQNDNFAALSNEFALYNQANYTDNEHLQDVVMNHTFNTNPARERCEFYVHSFSAKDAQSLSDGWPWNKVEGIGDTNRFRIQSGMVRLLINGAPVAMRLKSREEADARFEIDDSTGCRFSLDPTAFEITNAVGGAEAEVRLSAVRDEVTSSTYEYDTKGILARLLLDQSAASTNITLYLYEKSGGTNTWGTQLDSSGPMTFVPGATLELFVDEDSAELSYNGTNYCTGAHTNLDLASWPNGAVCVVEAAEATAGTTWYVDLDNFEAERPDASRDTYFAEGFADYPAGIMLRAETEYTSLRHIWASSRESESYVTNSGMFWIPEETAKGGSWYNGRRDYHDDVRLAMTATNVLEVQVAYSNFTEGISKIAFMPEYFPAELYSEYNGPLIYTEIKYQTNGRLVFDLVRQWGAFDGTRQWVAWANDVTYVPGQVVTFQVGSSTARVYYGTNLLINSAHGTNAAQVYANGAFPHLEFQNEDYTTNAIVTVESVEINHLSEFTAP